MNASEGHASHEDGRDVDITTANKRAANVKGDPAFSTELGKMFIDTGVIDVIFYNDYEVIDAVNAYAKEKGLPARMEFWPNHFDHFHVRVLEKFALEKVADSPPPLPPQAPPPTPTPTPLQTVAPATEKEAQFALSPEDISLIDSLPIEQWKKDNLKSILPLIMTYSTTNDTVTVAQWWVESNAGHDCPGNNCSGMKPDGYWHGETQTFMTFEYYNGVRKEEAHVFKKYSDLASWIKDHDALINRAPHYKDAVAAKDNWRAYLHGLINPGEPAYATAPNYEAVLTDVIENNHLEELTK